MPRDGSDTFSKPAGTTAISGEVISSSAFNTLVDDIVADLNLDRPIAAGGTGASTAADARGNLGVDMIAAKISRQNTISFASGSSTTITFLTETLDTDGLVDLSTDNDRITIPADLDNFEWGLLIGTAQWSSNSTGYREINLLKNGSQLERSTVQAANGRATWQHAATIVSVASADYFSMLGLQASGGALDLVEAHLTLIRIGS